MEWDIKDILDQNNKEDMIDIILEQDSRGLIIVKNNKIVEWDFWANDYKELEKKILEIIKD